MSTTDDIRTEILAIRAQCDRTLAKLDAMPSVVKTELIWATPAQYAEMHGLCSATICRYVKRGMPSERLPGGIRIKVKEADVWMASKSARAASVEASAAAAARRAG